MNTVTVWIKTNFCIKTIKPTNRPEFVNNGCKYYGINKLSDYFLLLDENIDETSNIGIDADELNFGSSPFHFSAIRN